MALSQDEIDRMKAEQSAGGDARKSVAVRIGEMFVRSFENIVPILIGSSRVRIAASEPVRGDLAGWIGALPQDCPFFAFREPALSDARWAGFIGRAVALEISQRMMGQEGAEGLNEALLSALVEAFNNILGAFDTALTEEFDAEGVTHEDVKFLEGSPLDALRSEAGLGAEENVWLIRIAAGIDDVSGELGIFLTEGGLDDLAERHPSAKRAAAKAQEAAVGAAAVPMERETAQEAVPEPIEEHVADRRKAEARPNVQTARFEELEQRRAAGETKGIELILDVPLSVAVELGRKKLSVREILALSPGSLVELEKLAGEAVDLLVNGKLFAKGEVVVIDENFGVRVSAIISPKERIERLAE